MCIYRAEYPGCGTTACIAGSTIFLFDKKLWDEYDDRCQSGYALNSRWMDTVASRAAELLGLPVPDKYAEDDPDHLFYQFDIKTPEEAAAALRALNVNVDAK